MFPPIIMATKMTWDFPDRVLPNAWSLDLASKTYFYYE